MPSAPDARRSAARLLPALAATAVAAVLPLAAVTPARAAADPLAGRTIVGRLVQAYPESAQEDHAPAEEPLSWVQPARGAAVKVATGDLADTPAGATVQVTIGSTATDPGVPDATHSVTDSTVLAPPALPAAPVTAALTDRVTVVLVEAGGGRPDGTSLQDLTGPVDGPVHDFWSQQTGGAVTLGVTATRDWVATTAGCDQPTALWDQAAAAAGFTAGPGNHLLVYLSRQSTGVADCSYGLAEVGTGLGSGGRLYVQDTLPSLLAHELGHNFGLGHSSARQCDSAVDTGACRTEGYRDYYDVMGASWEHVGTLNAAQEARLGVLPAAQRQVYDAAGAGGTATLSPLSGRTGTRALELIGTGGSDYWIEYRPAAGQDSWLGTAADRLGLQAGVLLHRSGDLPDTSLLLDGTPSAASGWDGDLQAALPVGTPVRLADGFTVTVAALTAAAASITVTTAPGALAAPAAAAAPGPATLPAARCPGSSCSSGAPSHAAVPVTGSVAQQPPAAAVAGSAASPRAERVALAASNSTSLPALAAVGGLAGCLAVAGGVLFRVRGRSRAVATSPGDRPGG